MVHSLEYQGCRLAFRVDGTGPPLVLIQGVGAQGTSSNPLVEILARHYSCLGFDNRGIGASQPAGRPLSTVQMAHDTLALMSHLNWDSAHIVGHSFGALVALALALEARGRVRSLSLLCPFARGADAIRLSPKLFWILFRLRFAPRSMRQRAFLDLVLPPGRRVESEREILDRLAKILGHEVADIPPIAYEQVAAMRASDVTARLGELACIPTLVVSAEEDLVARPALGKSIAHRMGGARFVPIPGAAHSFPVLEPERCAVLLMEHMTQADRAAAKPAPERS